jgi:hypothetical protein
MAVPVAGKGLLDTKVFIDYLRAGLHTDWVFGRVGNTVRFLSAIGIEMGSGLAFCIKISFPLPGDPHNALLQNLTLTCPLSTAPRSGLRDVA